MIRLSLDPDGQTVALRLTEYLGGERFATYRDICAAHGARYVPANKTNRAAVEAVLSIVAALRAAELQVDLDSQIADRLSAEADEATRLLTAGQARLAAADRLLAPTGLRLYPYQRTGVEWLAPRKRALLADEMGCVDGDAIVAVNRARRGFRMTLRSLCQHHNGFAGKWDLSIPTYCRALCNDELRQHRIIAVVDKGVRQTLRVTLALGKELCLTADHEIATPFGYRPASTLRPGHQVLTNGQSVCPQCGTTEGLVTYQRARFRGTCRMCVYRHKRSHPRKKGRTIDNDGYVRTCGYQDHPRANRAGQVYEHVDTVISIEPAGERRVYDIVMADPHRNFVANGIVVHNCGKTPQALMAAPDKAAVLVVAPASVKLSWVAEARRWRPDLSVETIDSRDLWRWPRPGTVLICTYGTLPDPDEIPVPDCEVTVIADECHLLKSPRALRTRRFRAVAATAADHDGRVWLLSGTPLLNRPPELWAVLQAAHLAETAFGSWPAFVRAFNGSKSRFGYEWGRADDSVPDAIRKVSLRRHRVDVLPDLPVKTRRDIVVNGLAPDVVSLCDEVVEVLRGKGIDLQQVTKEVEESRIAGAAFELMSRARAMLATAKIGALQEIVESFEEQEEPLVVFSAHKAPVEAIGAREGWGLVTGETPADERGRLVEAFQAGRLRGLAGTIGAMGTGVTLTRAHHLVMVDLAWTPALNSQAEDRVCRIGQDRGVIIHRIIADHALDHRVTELLTVKQDIIEASVEASAVEADYRGSSPAEELAAHAQAAAKIAAEARVAATAEQARIDAANAQARAVVATSLNGQADGRQIEVCGKFRGPCNAREDAVKQALLVLANLDPDHARAINGVGFSKVDNDFGHSLAQALQQHGRLSDKQWMFAEKLAIKYRRQVGELP